MTLDQIDAFCRSLPKCEVRYPFDSSPALRAWCLDSKMFAWTRANQQPLSIQLKANPDLIPALIASYEYISPGYHMNKRHWITINADLVDPTVLLGLLEDAHCLIVDSLPAQRRLALLGY